MKYIKIICLYLKKYISDKQFEKIFYQNIDDFENVLKEEIAKEVEHEIGKYGYSLFIFVVTDIINSNSLLFVYGKEIDLVQNAFKKDVVDNEVLLENVVSRKKQIIPFLMTAAQNM